MIVSATRLANRPARIWDRRPLRRGVPTHRRGPPCRRSDRTTARSKTESRRAESSTRAEACAPSSIRLEKPPRPRRRESASSSFLEADIPVGPLITQTEIWECPHGRSVVRRSMSASIRSGPQSSHCLVAGANDSNGSADSTGGCNTLEAA